ncbi:Ankyrin repeat [Dillenia turbinata]|uniref:Ankyrin repeat n=1 Tax=Dillenia turbinata TaxID=194707 RepID=A0AAN8ZQY6_9MAGN
MEAIWLHRFPVDDNSTIKLVVDVWFYYSTCSSPVPTCREPEKANYLPMESEVIAEVFQTKAFVQESYLTGEDLWDVVIGKENSQEKDAKALEVIKSSCGFDLRQRIDINEFKSAQTAWNQLYSHFVCTRPPVNPPPVLEDDNYENWSKSMQEYLESLGLWDVVDKEIHEHSKIWEQKNAKALHHIQISCGQNTLHQILDLNSAKAAWEKLASIQRVDPYLPLYHDLKKAGNPMIRQLLESKTVPDELRRCITPYRQTIFHIATMQQQKNVVKDLVKKLTPEDLKQKDDMDDTALLLAARVGNEKIARYIIESCPELVTIGNAVGDIPLVVAAHFGHKSTVRYLYSVTPEEHLNPDHPRYDPRHPHGTRLLVSCINDEFFDIALDLAKRFPKLASGREKSGVEALQKLASKPLAFQSGKERVFWKQWIYSCMPVELPHAASKASRGDPETGHEGQTTNQDMIARESN